MMIEAKFSSIFAKAQKKKIEGTFFPACAPKSLEEEEEFSPYQILNAKRA